MGVFADSSTNFLNNFEQFRINGLENNYFSILEIYRIL